MVWNSYLFMTLTVYSRLRVVQIVHNFALFPLYDISSQANHLSNIFTIITTFFTYYWRIYNRFSLMIFKMIDTWVSHLDYTRWGLPVERLVLYIHWFYFFNSLYLTILYFIYFCIFWPPLGTPYIQSTLLILKWISPSLILCAKHTTQWYIYATMYFKKCKA